MIHRPPQILFWLLRLLARNPHTYPIFGDFQECYDADVRDHGQRRANLQLTVEIIRSLPAFLSYQLSWGIVMFSNYLRIAVRNLLKQKGYSLLNVVGLAIGIACCVLILLFVRHELSFDNFHERADQIYRLNMGTGNAGQSTNANSSYLQGIGIRDELPEVREVVRFRKMGWGEKRVFARNEQRFYEERFFFADSNIFEVFSFPLLKGDASTVLDAPYQIVISNSMTKKYFAGENPVGQSINLDAYNNGEFLPYQITGIFADVPANSHIQFDFLASFSSQVDDMERLGWGMESVYTYVTLNEGVDIVQLEAKMAEIVDRRVGPDPWYSLHLQPLQDIHLNAGLRAEPTPAGDMAYVYIFSSVAAFILLLACINFMNLATARSARRAREVGMRKVLGAFRGQLIKQFLGEALLLSLIAAVLAVLLLYLMIPILNQMLEQPLVISMLNIGEVALGILGIALLSGLIAGSYPAFVLSAFRPSETVKGNRFMPNSWASRLRRGLVVFQFSISIVLMICTAVIFQQLDYIRTKNLGFAREQLLVSPINDQIRERFEGMKSFVLSHPDIQALTTSEQVPARAGNGASFRIEGMEEPLGLTRLFVDHDFNSTYDLDILFGRDFSEAFAEDEEEAFIISNSLFTGLGFDHPDSLLGKQVHMRHGGQTYPGRIVGITEDFHLFSFRNAIPAVVLKIMPPAKMNFVSLRVTAENVGPVLAHLEKAWAQFAPDYPFEYSFLDDDFAQLHKADTRMGNVFRYFAALAIIVACLGLLGLATFTAEQRTREIGVRKVLGASGKQILILLSREFTQWVMIAVVIAWPLAYWLMTLWLADFQHRITPGLLVFLLPAAVALLLAILTISFQTIRAIFTNPVEALRYE